MDSMIIVCAGAGTRTKLGFNKIFFPLGKKSVLDTVIDTFRPFGQIILVASYQDIDNLKNLYPEIKIVLGGSTRSDSVRAGLRAAEGSEIVAIHDAARPFVTADIISRALTAARRTGSGITAIKSVDAVCTGIHGEITESYKKENLYCIQTPQCFKYLEITDAYARITGSFADESEVYRLAGYVPTLTEGSYLNKKLTTPADFLALSPLSALGSGFDVHTLAEGRKLILGGIEIPFSKGLLGHSDADVLTHSIIDAVLSAAGQPDIGVLFPDNDNKYKDIDSLILLDKALELLGKAGLMIVSLSCVVMAQQPKLSGFIPLIRENLARRMNMHVDKINVSATTTEFMGIIGEGKAIAASAAVLCNKL